MVLEDALRRLNIDRLTTITQLKLVLRSMINHNGGSIKLNDFITAVNTFLRNAFWDAEFNILLNDISHAICTDKVLYIQDEQDTSSSGALEYTDYGVRATSNDRKGPDTTPVRRAARRIKVREGAVDNG